MTSKARFGLAAGAVFVALAVVLGAAATPQLNISATSAGTTVGFAQAASDPAPAKVQIFGDSALPTVDLSAAPGATIGSVTARAAAGALGGAVLPLTGSIVVAAAGDSYTSNGTPVPLATVATACTGTATHSAFWILKLSAAGQTLELPAFVDAVALPFAKVTIVFCLPSPDVPPPAGAAFGAKVLQAFLTLKGVFGSPTGTFQWRALVTPYTPGTATVNAAGTVEIQGVEHAPGAMTFSAKRADKGKASVTGTVTAGGTAVAGATVVVRGGKKALVLKTGTNGSFKGVVATRTPAGRLAATVTVAPKDLGASACQATFGAQGVPCVSAFDGGFTVTAAAKPK